MSGPSAQRLRIGTAGWSVAPDPAAFAGAGTHLARYARRLWAVEINSSFYRPHRRQTYARWAGSVPDGFAFAVKVPRAVTHERRLVDCADPVARFAEEVGGLGDRLGPLLVQLPPSLPFDRAGAEAFLKTLRAACPAPAVCEPRHRSWFTGEADACLAALGVARVAADPALVPAAGEPGGAPGLVYLRLHGAPRIYYDDYGAGRLADLASRLAGWAAGGTQVWCIFDNTALGHALRNALDLQGRLGASPAGGGAPPAA